MKEIDKYSKTNHLLAKAPVLQSCEKSLRAQLREICWGCPNTSFLALDHIGELVIAELLGQVVIRSQK